MGPAMHDASTRRRVALASMGAAALAILAPLLLFTVVDAPSTVSLAVVTLVLAALVRFGDHGAVLAARAVVTRPPATRETPPVLTGRISDPTHHPLRPRAPGMA
jgi:hypothetical protein